METLITTSCEVSQVMIGIKLNPRNSGPDLLWYCSGYLIHCYADVVSIISQGISALRYTYKKECKRFIRHSNIIYDMEKRRIIALIDMDCFYVQVEQRLQPHLYGKPVAVVQHSSANNRGGGLLAVSYEARSFGIKRGMFGEQAKALCPDLTLCYVPIGEYIDKADITRYRDASAEVFKVLHEFDSRIIVERASVDEAYLDLSALVQNIFETTNPSTKVFLF
ncbi:unnamed protein product [Onchocerca flexuosa]|uniref:UmuC domain-containing protein n=1 Tax=Onchocerca flexuosa TaxID=387005 RepID=A0A183H5R8_9BILA|nr:unnamed protein product [Onchocerca flexuosa]